MINYYAKEAYQQNKVFNFESHKDNTKVVLSKVLSTHIALTRFGTNNLSEEERRDTLGNDKSLSMLLQNPYLIIPEIVRMSKNLKQQLAALDKQEQHTNGSLSI